MEIQNLLHADYLDILFDQRNKSYGGYELRKHYSNRASRATLITLFITGSLCAYSLLRHEKQTVIPHTITCPITLTNLQKHVFSSPPPKAPTQVTNPPATHVHTEMRTPPVITNNDVKSNDLLRPNDKQKDAVPGPHTSDGTGDAAIATANGDGTIRSVQPPSPSKPVIWVEQMPEFVGNLNNYIVSQIHYPEAAKVSNITGRVIVRFVVNEDGTISNATVMKGIGGGCDEEALRVINSMPKWKPGKQNGVPVKVYYNIPINFVLQ